MSPTRTDWTFTKRSRIVILRENDLSYAETARQSGGSVTCSVYESSVYVMKSRNQWKIRPNHAEKYAQVLLPIEKLNRYAFKIEKFHRCH